MVKWSAENFVNQVEADLSKKFVKAGLYFVSKLRQSLNVSQPYRRTSGGKHVGLAPSLPGQYPKKLSGQLMRSITWSVGKAPLSLTVGSNLKGYPSYLESGTRIMQARPWLSLGYQSERDAVGRMIIG